MFTSSIRRFALASTLVLAGTMAITPKASAENVSLDGTQSASCTFGSASSGTDAISFPTVRTLTSTSVTIPLTCTNPNATLATSVARTTAPIGTATSSPSVDLTRDGDAFTSNSVFGDGTKTVGMVVSDSVASPAVFRAGTYTYTVTLTATP